MDNKKTEHMSFRLSKQGRASLVALSRKYGISQGSVVEMLVRIAAASEEVRDAIIALETKEGSE